MKQALRILGKDMRHLWRELAFLVLCAIVNAFYPGYGHGWAAVSGVDFQHTYYLLGGVRSDAFFGPSLSGMALCAAAVLLIVGLVHAETIPGDRQFWMTRPYRWTSLLGAKVAFLVLGINLPILLVRLALLTAMGFPFSASLPALAWSHFLFTIGVALPAAAVAAMTSNRSAFVFLGLGLLILWVTFSGGIPRSPLSWANREDWPAELAWVPTTVLAITGLTVVSTILLFQYGKRLTAVSRRLAFAAASVSALTYAVIPPSFAMAVQEKLPVSREAASAHPVWANVTSYLRKDGTCGLRCKILVRVGTEGRTEREAFGVGPDAVRTELETADGRIWHSDWLVERGFFANKIIEQRLRVDRTFLHAAGDAPLKMRILVYWTVLSAPGETVSLPVIPGKAAELDSLFSPAYMNVGNGLQCAGTLVEGPLSRPVSYSLNKGPVVDVRCRAAVAWPNAILIGTLPPGEREPSVLAGGWEKWLSYSPFPGGDWGFSMTANVQGAYRLPVDQAGLSKSEIGPIQFHIATPLAHFIQTVDAGEIRLREREE